MNVHERSGSTSASTLMKSLIRKYQREETAAAPFYIEFVSEKMKTFYFPSFTSTSLWKFFLPFSRSLAHFLVTRATSGFVSQSRTL